MPNDRDIDAPVSLAGLFDIPNDSDEEEGGAANEFSNDSEEQTVVVSGKSVKVRQYVFRSHNANRVWPGTFNLAEHYIDEPGGGSISDLTAPESYTLELGTATGLLAIRLAMEGVPIQNIITSDVKDEGSEVKHNVVHNFELNSFSADQIPRHVEHTWGTGWPEVGDDGKDLPRRFDTILASDILLYCAAYPALVKTLCELMPFLESEPSSITQKFVMSWNRRMPESSEFFDLIKEAGFACHHEGKCVYVFTRTSEKGVKGGYNGQFRERESIRKENRNTH
jgi:hypothetical protein